MNLLEWGWGSEQRTTSGGWSYKDVGESGEGLGRSDKGLGRPRGGSKICRNGTVGVSGEDGSGTSEPPVEEEGGVDGVGVSVSSGWMEVGLREGNV